MRFPLPWPGRRDFLILVTVAAVVALAWALYPSSTYSDVGSGREAIVLWLPPQPEFRDPYLRAAREFERRHPGYVVRIGSAVTRDTAGDPTRFLLGVAGGVPPDVILFDRFAIVEWAARGAFLDLTERIQSDIASGVSSPIQANDFYEVAWNEASYGDAIYAIPTDTDTRALFVNNASLQRAGLVNSTHDEEVQGDRAKAGQPRPPRTWEEMSHKLGHFEVSAAPDGTVQISDFRRAPYVNEQIPIGAVPDLMAAGVRAGDVVSLVSGSDVFRGRIATVTGTTGFTIDFDRDQRPGLTSLPPAFHGEVEAKIFSQDDYVSRLTRIDPTTGLLAQAPMLPLLGNSHLILFGWLNGAEFLSPDGHEIQLDTRETGLAMQWLSDVYDQMGGYRTANLLWTSTTSGGVDAFIAGRVAMVIHINTYVNNILISNPGLEFTVAPSPQPSERAGAGFKPVGWGGGFAFGIPVTSQRKDAAWKLIRFMCSSDGMDAAIRGRERIAEAKGIPFFPPLSARPDMVQRMREKYVQGNPRLMPWHRDAFDVFMDLLPTNRHRPVTPVGQKLWQEQFRAAENALSHVYSPREALSLSERNAQRALDRILQPPTGQRINWPIVLSLYAVSLVTFFASVIVKGRHRRTGNPVQSGWVRGYVCVAPWLVGFAVFGAGPILFTILVSFGHYDVLNPARLIGWDNYVQLVGWHQDASGNGIRPNDPLFWKSLGNTLFMAMAVPVSVALGLAIALLLNANVRGQSVFRTLFYLPSIVPAVATFVLWMWLFEPAQGGINSALSAIGFDGSPPRWLRDPAWAKPSLIIMGLWGVGGGMIIWLAGLKDIPRSLYEAAEIDGAGRWKQFRHVTLPMLSPYILFNVVMGFIHAFQVFESAYVMTQGGPSDATLFYAYKLFNESFRYLDMGKASAMAWILFLIVMGITLFQLHLSRKWVHYRG